MRIAWLVARTACYTNFFVDPVLHWFVVLYFSTTAAYCCWLTITTTRAITNAAKGKEQRGQEWASEQRRRLHLLQVITSLTFWVQRFMYAAVRQCGATTLVKLSFFTALYSQRTITPRTKIPPSVLSCLESKWWIYIALATGCAEASRTVAGERWLLSGRRIGSLFRVFGSSVLSRRRVGCNKLPSN